MPNSPYFFLRILRILFCNELICPSYGGVTCPFQFFHEGTQTFVVVSWWTLKLTHLLGFRLVLFNDSFFYTPFRGSLAPYSRHFFILIVGAMAPTVGPNLLSYVFGPIEPWIPYIRIRPMIWFCGGLTFFSIFGCQQIISVASIMSN